MPAPVSTMSGRVLVYGGRGALGSEIVTKFKHEGWWVANIDTAPNTQVGSQGCTINPGVETLLSRLTRT